MDDIEKQAKQEIEARLPDPTIRRAILSSLADAVVLVNRYSKSCWGVNEGMNLQFTHTSFYTPYIWWINNQRTGEVMFHLDNDDVLSLSKEERKLLTEEAKLRTDDTEWIQAFLCLPRQDSVFELVNNLFQSYVEKKIGSKPDKVLSKRCQNTHRKLGAGYIQYMRSFLDRPDIPQPGWYIAEQTGIEKGPSIGPDKEPPMTPFEIINQYLQDRGYQFTPIQIASFYTALQTKGFVILSGISGTGKTKLAQLFAEMLPSPGQKDISQPENIISVFLEFGHDLSPVNALIKYLPTFQFIDLKQRIAVPLNFNGITQQCEIRLDEYPDKSQHLLFWFQNEAIQWFEKNYPVGSNLYLRPEITDNKFVGLTILEESNCLFMSVRPDWRDGKSLLGYYNPLMKSYQWTPFLEFLIKARNSFDKHDGQAWFMILDEMNLARVEYYFADLLSVLESGRDDEGNTKEPLRFQIGEIEKGQKPSQHIYLPPNLYIIGTVNMDETTQSFSPKVLDRAFSIEFLDVDFSTYNLSISDKTDTLEMQKRQELQKLFTRGVFARIDKNEISKFTEFGKFQRELTALNEKLTPYNHHFGYRVFDEIMMFLKNAQENRMYEETDSQHTEESMMASAFDQAVLMKVLPKFHGSRGKLEKPLRGILTWCAKTITEPEIEELLKNIFNAPESFNCQDWRYPATAHRVVRMIQSLNSTGFASFG